MIIFRDYSELHKSREVRGKGLGRGVTLPPQDRGPEVLPLGTF